MRLRTTLAISAASVAWPALAADLGVKLELPRLNVAEYHRPYVAIWIESADQRLAGNLAVWYQLEKSGQASEEGTKWLKDLRSWWRKSGRDLAMPVDGLSGATRPPGTHSLSFGSARGPLKDLPPGEYQLVVEAAREVGGRELVRVPFQWPPTAAVAAKGQGSVELGAVQLELKP